MNLSSFKKRTVVAIVFNLILVTLIAVMQYQDDYVWGYRYDIHRLTGYIAVICLMLSILMGDLTFILSTTKYFKNQTFSGYQRFFGLFSFSLVSLHVLSAISIHLKEFWVSMLSWNYIQYGIASFIILMLMTITSFGGILGQGRWNLWKCFHRMVYIAFFLIFLHILYAPMSHKTYLFLLTTIFIFLRICFFLYRLGFKYKGPAKP